MAGNKILIGKVTLEASLIFIFIFIVTLVLGNVINALTRRFLENRLSKSNAKLTGRILQYAIFVAGLYYGIYHVLHLDLTALAASLGIIGIAVAFSSQQIIQNFIAGLLISVGRPIQIEEWVEIGGPVQTDVSKVEDITLTRTVLRDIHGKLFYIPNSALLSSKITNYTKSGLVNVPIYISIPFESDYEKIEAIIKEVANENKKILPNIPQKEKFIIKKYLTYPPLRRLFDKKTDMSVFEPRVMISEFSSSNITLLIQIWIREIDKKNEIVSEFLDSLLKRLKEKRGQEEHAIFGGS